MRLGIDITKPQVDAQFLWGEGAAIGFSRLQIAYGEDGYQAGGFCYDKTKIYACAKGDWHIYMKSLRAIAQELSVTPDLDPEEESIVGLIVSTGRRLTTTQILSEFSKRGTIKAESTVKGKLAQLTRRKVLVNRSDTNPKGYGLPEWD